MCCCIENGCCSDYYCGGCLTGCQDFCLENNPNVGSPVCACTNFLDEALQNLQSNPLPTDTADASCYQPLTSGTTDNPFCTCKPQGQNGFSGNSGSGNGSGSAAGACNKKATNQCTSALANAVNSLGSLLNKLTSSATGASVATGTSGEITTTPTTIGMIVIVLLLGGLLLAFAFGKS